jgi:cell division protein FtsN
MGLVAGLLIGLTLALGVALYITKAPVPFINKVPQRTAEQDTAETERNRNWDPNAALGGKAVARAASAAAASAAAAAASPPPGIATAGALPVVSGSPAMAASAVVPSKPAARDPAAILAGQTPNQPADSPARSTASAAEPFIYFVQAGAFTRTEDAEAQRAKLAMIGQAAKITEREQAGRTMYRVRLGPFPSRSDADGLQAKLQEQGLESQIVRVERP